MEQCGCHNLNGRRFREGVGGEVPEVLGMASEVDDRESVKRAFEIKAEAGEK